MIAGTVLAFARALGEFGATLMLAGNIPGRTQTMPIAIFSAVESGHPAIALVWVSLIVVISLAIIRLLNVEKKARPRGYARSQSESVAELLPQPLPQFQPQAKDSLNVESGAPQLTVDVARELDKFSLHAAFEVRQGTLGLLGPSGSGKSMTLRMIAGLSRPDSGRVTVHRKVLFDSGTGKNLSAAARKVGFVFQDFALFPHLTVAGNVGFGLRSLPKAERESRVAAQLATLHISDLADRLPGEISGGQKQRVAIARCMVTEPDLLLLDEPFSALDPHLRRQTEEQLRATLAGFKGCVVFVTHDMEEAFRFCSDLMVLDQGQVIAHGPKHQLFERPGTVAAARLTGCKNIAPARCLANDRITVEAWGIELKSNAAVPDDVSHVGYRSHQFTLQGPVSAQNSFLCRLVSTSEAPHEMTLYLRLGSEPAEGQPHHLQADIPKEAWRTLRQQPQPWRVTLEPERLLLLRD